MLLNETSSSFTRITIQNDITLILSDAMTVKNSAEDNDVMTVHIESKSIGKVQTIWFSVPLAGAVMFWQSSGRFSSAQLAPDWAGTHKTCCAMGAPIGCLIDGNDQAICGFALLQMDRQTIMRYGVDEDYARYAISLTFIIPQDGIDLVVDTSRREFHTVIEDLAAITANTYDPMIVPEFVKDPVYSTWTAFLQNINDKELESEIDLIKSLGCKSVYIDAGWEGGRGRSFAYNGDWTADRDKFPDLVSTIRFLRDNGLKTVLWVAPLLLGTKARSHDEWVEYAPVLKSGDAANMRFLDPRCKQVREHVVDVCEQLFKEYRPDGLKIDFLDEAASSYFNRKPTHIGDEPDVGIAMLKLMQDMRKVFDSVNPTPIIEFRQPYSGPSSVGSSNVTRAADCPADSITNRVRVIDERLEAAGRTVQSDMLLWGVEAEPWMVAQQFMSVFFSVPQISVRPSFMTPHQYKVCKFMLYKWIEHRSTSIDGKLCPIQPAANYPLITATRGADQVSAVYVNDMSIVISTQTAKTVMILNSTSSPRLLLRWKGKQPFKYKTSIFDCEGTLTRTMMIETVPEAVYCMNDVPAYGIVELVKSV